MDDDSDHFESADEGPDIEINIISEKSSYDINQNSKNLQDAEPLGKSGLPIESSPTYTAISEEKPPISTGSEKIQVVKTQKQVEEVHCEAAEPTFECDFASIKHDSHETEIQDTIAETDLLIKEKRRLENALMESEVPLLICTENLNTRDQLEGIDKVADVVEKELLTEFDVIHSVQEVLKKTIEQSECQIAQNRAIKEAMEMNWSDKLEAEHWDARAGYLTNSSTNKQFYAGEHMSDPESWAKAAHEVISQAESERKSSAELRRLISNLLTETARDLREHHDLVCRAFAKNIDRMITAKIELETQLKKTVDEVVEQERNIERLKEAIRAKDDPLKVVQTRLHLRGFRPNSDLCKDTAMERQVLNHLVCFISIFV
ncbi:unnamed protein product [Echinostoma caproni]|uniref:Tektin n=1 Tax=Echinostoma caproni TaxID=27848 RepID=A0A183AVM1_9TREM|nr:unnamed protein product [Echinostoma caproni]